MKHIAPHALQSIMPGIFLTIRCDLKQRELNETTFGAEVGG